MNLLGAKLINSIFYKFLNFSTSKLRNVQKVELINFASKRHYRYVITHNK